MMQPKDVISFRNKNSRDVLCIGILIFLVFCTKDSLAQKNVCDTIYTIVDQMPAYGKSPEDISRYVSKHVEFQAACLPVGPIIMSFIINKEGLMTDVYTEALEGACRVNFLEQMKKLDNWTPGRLNGESVCVKMSLPLRLCFKQ